jgi:hypothetical protein
VGQQITEPTKCEWCDEIIQPHEPHLLVDGEDWMHLHCAAEEADNYGPGSF